jgi:hypothetical protein
MLCAVGAQRAASSTFFKSLLGIGFEALKGTLVDCLSFISLSKSSIAKGLIF